MNEVKPQDKVIPGDEPHAEGFETVPGQLWLEYGWAEKSFSEGPDLSKCGTTGLAPG